MSETVTIIKSIKTYPHQMIINIVLVFLLAAALFFGMRIIYQHFRRTQLKLPWLINILKFVFYAIKQPLIFLLCSTTIIFSLSLNHAYGIKNPVFELLHSFKYLQDVFVLTAYFWFVFNILIMGKNKILRWSSSTGHTTINLILPAIINSLQAVVFLLMLNMIVPKLKLYGLAGEFADKAIRVLLIATIGWIFIQITNVLEHYITNQYVIHDVKDFAARKINTQVLILKRVIVTITIIITFAAILRIFDSVRNIGTGLLTTAGIISAIGAFASQQSLGRLFAGLQIAFTQPFRIGDTIIIENEMGQVEQITLSYVVVKLWDLRRLILPTDYFTAKGLLNLTRDTTQLLGTIFIYADYTLPVETVRQKFYQILESSPLWDKNVKAFHVTNIKESTLELRALMSAENSSTLWRLRCDIREKLIKYIVDEFPECLSKSRSLTTNITQP